MAFDMIRGKKLWSRQFTAKDVWNSGCVAEKKDNCPDGARRRLLFRIAADFEIDCRRKKHTVLAQKSGMVYGVDPENRGELLWKTP